MTEQIFFGICLLAALILLLDLVRRKHRVRALLWGSGSGLALLAALAAWGGAIGFVPVVNPLAISVSIFLGIPGIVLLAVLQSG